MPVFINFDENCDEMIKTLKSDTKLLKAIHESQKFF